MMIDRKPGCHGFDLFEDERALKKAENSGGYWDTTWVEKMECSAFSRELCYTLGEIFSASTLLALKGQGIKMRGHEVIHIIHSFSLPPRPPLLLLLLCLYYYMRQEIFWVRNMDEATGTRGSPPGIPASNKCCCTA
jgi:hypothetical protein